MLILKQGFDILNASANHILTQICFQDWPSSCSTDVSVNERLTFLQDWPDDLHMSAEAFEKYAIKLEMEDFEDDIRNLSSSLHQLIYAREDTIQKLRKSADYLDSIWVR